MLVPWTVNYSDTGAGLPWEVRFDHLRNNGWTTPEIMRLQAKEMREAAETEQEQEADDNA